MPVSDREGRSGLEDSFSPLGNTMQEALRFPACGILACVRPFVIANSVSLVYLGQALPASTAKFPKWFVRSINPKLVQDGFTAQGKLTEAKKQYILIPPCMS